MKKVLITGAAGFIGYHLSQRLLSEDFEVCGVDNLNEYYDPALKKARLARIENSNFLFKAADLSNFTAMSDVFAEIRPDIVINLAAQAGVRYSLENPRSYIQSNIDGFFNLIELSKDAEVENFIYASSSSVYGNSQKTPFSETDSVDHPVSLYAATKKSNELIAHTYSHLYQLPTVGLRFFTVYGPWGRPDMAYYFFTQAILENRPIKLFNDGKNLRDYTYISDIVEGISRIISKQQTMLPTSDYDQYRSASSPYYQLFNIGGSNPISVLAFVETLEKIIGKKARAELVGFQPGDVFCTEADTQKLDSLIQFVPEVQLETGLNKFVKWYKEYYKV